MRRRLLFIVALALLGSAAALLFLQGSDNSPPSLTPEDLRIIQEGARRAEHADMESLARAALTEACGADVRCQGLESINMRGVVPVVQVENLECSNMEPSLHQPRSCRFSARHPGTNRTVSCTMEATSHPGDHMAYWSFRGPPPPEPERTGQALLPSMPSLGPSTLRCSSDVHELVATTAPNDIGTDTTE